MNQPAGFQTTGSRKPAYYYGRRHDYVYFPIAWTDTRTGTAYEKGYYDENGRRYENVAFEKDGKYENVICHCPYCEQDTLLNLDADKLSAQSLKCPHCNGPMEIRSELDEAVGEAAGGTEFRTAAQPKKKKRRGLTAVIIVLALALLGKYGSELEETTSPTGQNEPVQQIYTVNNGASDPSALGRVVSLVQAGDGAYAIAAEGQNADRQMVWDADADSYYDADSDCWLWYNTDVEPAVWQYWYEGISSDFGDFGWMEHEDSGWYIEASEGDWIPLPGAYSTEGLWYIAE